MRRAFTPIRLWWPLACARIVGPRVGKFICDGLSNAIIGHDISAVLVGCFILAFGWFGFNPGSTLGASAAGCLHINSVAVNTMLAGCTGTFGALSKQNFERVSEDRRSGQLAIERRILFQTLRTAYDAFTIDRVYVRDTRRGSGLYVRFKSGRKKRLSVSLEFIPLDAFAIHPTHSSRTLKRGP